MFRRQVKVHEASEAALFACPPLVSIHCGQEHVAFSISPAHVCASVLQSSGQGRCCGEASMLILFQGGHRFTGESMMRCK